MAVAIDPIQVSLRIFGFFPYLMYAFVQMLWLTSRSVRTRHGNAAFASHLAMVTNKTAQEMQTVPKPGHG